MVEISQKTAREIMMGLGKEWGEVVGYTVNVAMVRSSEEWVKLLIDIQCNEENSVTVTIQKKLNEDFFSIKVPGLFKGLCRNNMFFQKLKDDLVKTLYEQIKKHPESRLQLLCSDKDHIIQIH